MEKFKEKAGLVIFELCMLIPFLLIRQLSGNSNFLGVSTVWLITAVLGGALIIFQNGMQLWQNSHNPRKRTHYRSDFVKEGIIFIVLFALYVLVVKYLLNNCEITFVRQAAKIISKDIKQFSAIFNNEPIQRRVLLPLFLLPLISELILIKIPSDIIQNNTAVIWVTSILSTLVVCANLPHPVCYFVLYFPIALYIGYRFVKTDKNLIITMVFNIVVDCTAALALVE